eukprot:15454583-Alexandrium_andersonii.AAC.1
MGMLPPPGLSGPRDASSASPLSTCRAGRRRPTSATSTASRAGRAPGLSLATSTSTLGSRATSA